MVIVIIEEHKSQVYEMLGMEEAIVGRLPTLRAVVKNEMLSHITKRTIAYSYCSYMLECGHL